MIVYKTTNLINGKIYIGQSVNNNDNYIGSGVYFKNALNKYGKNNFKKEILEILPENTLQIDLNECEAKWIKFYDATNKKVGYNLMEKSGQNGKYSKESRNKMSESAKGNTNMLGKHHTDETKIKISKSKKGHIYNLGYIHSDETKKIWSKQRLGRKLNDEWKEKISKGNKGIKRPKTEEHKKKLSIANLGKKQSKETKEKISKGNKGKHKFTDEMKNLQKNRIFGDNNPMKKLTKEKHPSATAYVIESINGDIFTIIGRNKVMETLKCSHAIFNTKKCKEYKIIDTIKINKGKNDN